jgi:hypothetical protein
MRVCACTWRILTRFNVGKVAPDVQMIRSCATKPGSLGHDALYFQALYFVYVMCMPLHEFALAGSCL